MLGLQYQVDASCNMLLSFPRPLVPSPGLGTQTTRDERYKDVNLRGREYHPTDFSTGNYCVYDLTITHMMTYIYTLT